MNQCSEPDSEATLPGSAAAASVSLPLSKRSLRSARPANSRLCVANTEVKP